MATNRKIFGVGMSKTGTTTLARCLEVLGFHPHASFNRTLKEWIEGGGDVQGALEYAEPFATFEDSPWYLIYKDLDRRFPGSKFILTVRKDSLTHAKSSWSHGARRGLRKGEPTLQYLTEKIRSYEAHNNEVKEYFRDRPKDLLVLCWENGDGWRQLCPFLDVPIPDQNIPHCNQARASILPKFVTRSDSYNCLVHVMYRAWARPPVQRIKTALQTHQRILRRRIGNI